MGMMEATATPSPSRGSFTRPPFDGPTEVDSDELVLRYIPRIHKLARAMARRLPPHVSVDDLIGAGSLGLLDAARRYDPALCDRFEAYAEHRIRGSMLDELRSHDSLSRDLRSRSRRRDEAVERLERELGRSPSNEDVAKELGIEIEEYEQLVGRIHRGTVLSAEALTRDSLGAQAFEDPQAPDPYQIAAARELRDILTRALESLPDRLQLVASLYYREGLKLSTIGKKLGVTEARACQLRGEAVRKLRDVLASWNVVEDITPRQP